MSNKPLVLLILASLLGCQKETTSSSGNTTPDLSNASKSSDASGSATLDCPGLLSCAGDCDTDACIQKCIDDTTDDGLAKTIALAQCIQENGCGAADETCVDDKCGDELAACAGTSSGAGGAGGAPSGGDGTFPARVSGTTLDSTVVDGEGYQSSANVVFVRDDAAGTDAGYPTQTVAFYRVESIDYHVESLGSCTDSADRSATDPDPFESNLLIELQATSSGEYKYGLAIGLEDGRTATCNNSISHYVTTDNTNQPLTDLKTFKGSWTVGPRERSWDLQAE